MEAGTRSGAGLSHIHTEGTEETEDSQRAPVPSVPSA